MFAYQIGDRQRLKRVAQRFGQRAMRFAVVAITVRQGTPITRGDPRNFRRGEFIAYVLQVPGPSESPAERYGPSRPKKVGDLLRERKDVTRNPVLLMLVNTPVPVPSCLTL